MFSHCILAMLALALTFDSRVHAGKIIGGQRAVPHSRPYMAIVQKPALGNNKTYCDGFLLNEYFVMTAAHCRASSYKVFLGVDSFYEINGVQEIPSAHYFIHKDYIYSGTNIKNDIMLIKLGKKANMTKQVQPIGLPDPESIFQPKSCLVSGWGVTSENNEHQSHVLMEVNVTLTDSQPCPKEHFYCSKGESGPHKGDSGGPLVCEDGKAHGIVSAFYPLQSNGSRLSVFTKIRNYENWIHSIMKEHWNKKVVVN